MLAETIMEYGKTAPDKLAVRGYDTSMTYGELVRGIMWAEEIFLNDFNDEPIGLLLSNSTTYIIFLLAAVKSHKKVILLGYDFKIGEIKRHLSVLGEFHILTYEEKGQEFAGNLNYYISKRYNLDTAEIVVLSNDHNSKFKLPTENNDFVIKCTSGSESYGKFSVRSEQQILNEIFNTCQCVNFEEQEVFLCLPPIWHSFGLIAGALLPLYYGKTLIMMRGFFPDVVVEMINKMKVNVLFAVPFMYRMLTERNYGLEASFSSLQMCFSAGAPLDKDTYEGFVKLTGCDIINDYGSTETGIMCLNTDMKCHFGAAGRMVANSKVRIVNSEFKDVPNGEYGEICIFSNAMSTRYIYPIDANRKQYREGYYCTRDYGYMDEDGYIFVEGRIDDFLIVAGKKTSSKEIEAFLMDFDEIDEAVITSSKGTIRGDIITAHIVINQQISEKTIKERCRLNLADYKIPQYIHIVDEIPKSASGKILKKYLFKKEEYS